MDEIGLAGEKGRRLQHVDHLGDRRDLRNVVDIGQDRHAELVAHLLEDAQPFVHARPAKAFVDERLALSKLDLKMSRMPSLSAMRFNRLGCAHLQLFAFDHARAGDQEQGLVEPDFASKQLHRRYLGEPVDNRHRLPVAKTVLRGEIFRERLAGMDSTADEDEVEAHARGPERIGQQRVAHRKHFVRRRIAGEVQSMGIDCLDAACHTRSRATEPLIEIGDRPGARFGHAAADYHPVGIQAVHVDVRVSPALQVGTIILDVAAAPPRDRCRRVR